MGISSIMARREGLAFSILGDINNIVNKHRTSPNLKKKIIDKLMQLETDKVIYDWGWVQIYDHKKEKYVEKLRIRAPGIEDGFWISYNDINNPSQEPGDPKPWQPEYWEKNND